MIKQITKSVIRASLVILCGIAFGLFLSFIMSSLDKQLSIILLVCILIGLTAFIDYKINN